MTNGRRQRDHLPCAIYQAHGKEFADDFKIGNKKDLIRRGPHHPATHPLCQVASWGIFCALHGRQDLNPQPPSCVTFSTTAPHSHLYLYSIFFPTYYTKLIVNYLFEALNEVKLKKLSTTKFHNFSRSTTFILAVFPSEVVYQIWISLYHVPDLGHTAKPGYLPCALIWYTTKTCFAVCPSAGTRQSFEMRIDFFYFVVCLKESHGKT